MPVKKSKIPCIILPPYLCYVKLDTWFIIIIRVEVLNIGVIHHFCQNSSHFGAIDLTLPLRHTRWTKIHRNMIILDKKQDNISLSALVPHLVECHGIDIKRGKHRLFIRHAGILHSRHFGREYDTHVTQVHIDSLEI